MTRLLAVVTTAALLAGFAPSPPVAAAPPSVTAEGAVLWDPVDDRVLWGRNETRPLPPASTTKIMTVLLALEAGTVDDTVTVSQKAVSTASSPGAATLNLRVGQTIPMRSLLQGLLLRSGNDAAVAVAEHVAGSEAAFVDTMNDRARQLGLQNTNFLNSTGLTNDLDHHSSALDLARLGEQALRNDDFAAWAAADTMTVADLGVLENRNELLGRYEGANGVKTGYTALAGLCLVASAERDGRLLVAVVLNADDSTSQGSFVDATAVLDHGFGDFRRAQPLRRRRPAVRYRWADAVVPLVARQPLGRTVAAGEQAVWQVEVEPAVERPIAAGRRLGEARLLVDGAVVDTTDLVAAEAVPAPPAQPGAVGAGAAVGDTLRAFARLAEVDRDA